MTTTTRVTFYSPDAQATFRVDPAKRTISGIALPWGAVARSGGMQWKFAPGSLHWSDVGRIKLNADHDRDRTFGRAVELNNEAPGLFVSFKLGRGQLGDDQLALAEDGIADGFSVEVDFEDGDEWVKDPSDPSIRLVKRATLRHVAQTSSPAFDDARVSSVAATREKGSNMETTDNTVTEDVQESAVPDLTTFTDSVATAISAAVSEAFARLDDPRPGQPVRAGRSLLESVKEPAVYRLNGHGPSLVRDAWHAVKNADHDARDRLHKYQSQQNDIRKQLEQRTIFSSVEGHTFATGTTGTLAEVVPPGYRPDLYVPELMQGRPFVSSISNGPISDATPFTVPRFVSAVGATADHVEGVNPADGTLDVESVTVTPGAVSGKLILTREIIDAANPAIDAIALAAMRESYTRQTEAKVYTQLNGTAGVGGVITAGRVPSGGQASTSAGGSIAAGTFGGLEMLRAVRLALALYPFRRFAAPVRMLLSQEATSGFASAEDSTNRPLLPSIGATNSAGVGNAVTQGWSVDGLPAVPAWSMTGNAAGDADVIGVNPADAWAWESPLLSFRFEEKSGPALIELALFGYFATQVLRPVGLFGIRHTRAA